MPLPNRRKVPGVSRAARYSGRQQLIYVKEKIDPSENTSRVRTAESDGLRETVEEVDTAVATSSVSGLRFDRDGRFHHLFDPRSGGCARGYQTASVVADRACDADALSTALVVARQPCLSKAVLRDLGVRRITVVDGNGSVRRLL